MSIVIQSMSSKISFIYLLYLSKQTIILKLAASSACLIFYIKMHKLSSR